MKTGWAFLSKASLVFISSLLLGIPFALANSEPCQTGLKSFAKNLHPFLVKRCLECHSNGPGPQHTTKDPVASYAHIRRYVSVNDVANSKLVKVGGDGHCQFHSDGAKGSACGASSKELSRRVQAWWDEGESKCLAQAENKESSAIRTFSIPLPADLPFDASTEVADDSKSFAVLKWHLGERHPELYGVYFRVLVRKIFEKSQSTPETYLFVRPAIYDVYSANGQALEVKGLRILLNGVYNPANSMFASIKVLTAGRPRNPFLLSARSMMVAADQGAKEDQVSIEFDSVRSRDAVHCKDPDLFSKQSLKVRTSCLVCHESRSSNAAQSFDLSGSPEENCEQFLARLDSLDLSGSPLFAVRFGAGKARYSHFDAATRGDYTSGVRFPKSLIIEDLKVWFKNEKVENEY